MGIFDFFTKKETENILKSPEYQCKCNLLELNKRIEADRYQNLDNIQAASFIKELEILYTNFRGRKQQCTVSEVSYHGKSYNLNSYDTLFKESIARIKEKYCFY